MNRQRHPHSAKSIFLAVLIVTMSLSAGIVEINRAPWLETEDVAAFGAGCPSITYSGSPFTFNQDVAISSITPSNSGDSATWSISPSLPSGLSIDSSTGVISGTPTVTASSASYVITATNSCGSDTATISVTVNAQAPSGLSYATENMTL